MTPMKKALWTILIVGIVIAAGYFVYVMYVPAGGGYIPPEPGNDTDNDGLPDTWERQYWGNLAQTASGDPDSDGFTNLQEYANVTNPTVSDLVPTPDLDTDDDGLPDAWEMQYFGNLNMEGNDNPDGDSYTNADEYANGTNPTMSNDINQYPFVEGWNVPGNPKHITITPQDSLYYFSFYAQNNGNTIKSLDTLTFITSDIIFLMDHGYITQQQYDCGMAQITALGG